MPMHLLKHILIAIALLMAAMPCAHALSHVLHGHDHNASVEMCAAHACSCHACDEVPCSGEQDPPQEKISSICSVEFPPKPQLLFVFRETKPAQKQTALPLSGALASIRTVQLLI